MSYFIKMDKQLIFKLLFIALILLQCLPIFAKLELYGSKEQYLGNLLYSTDLIPSPCENLPWWSWSGIASIFSSKCVILYSNENCLGKSYKVEGASRVNLPSNLEAHSFQACDQKNANIYFKDVRVNFYGVPSSRNEIMESHIREYVQIHIHCKDMIAYPCFTTDVCIILYAHHGCAGQQIKFYPGGKYCLYDISRYSFRPCNATDVIRSHRGFKLNANVVKFEIWSEPSEVTSQAKNGVIEMSEKTSFWNNGSSKLTQVYSVSKTILERVELQNTTSFSEMNTVSVSGTVAFEYTAGVPLVASSKISASLTAGYQKMNQTGGSSGEKYINETKKGFTVEQRIEVPPCTIYEVNSFVKTTKDYPVNYRVYVEVTGKYESGLPVPSQKIIEKLSGLKYNHTKDANTIIATSESHLTVEYAFDAEIVGNGRPLEQCLTLHNPQKPSTPNPIPMEEKNFTSSLQVIDAYVCLGLLFLQMISGANIHA